MPQGVRLPKDQLLARYRMSERLAARVGALLAKGIEISGALLEIAGPASPAEALLLHPDLLARSGQLQTSDLTEIAKATPGGDTIPPLVVHTGDGRKVVALEEEILAETAWRAPGPAGTGSLREVAPDALLRPGAGGGGGDLLKPAEAQELFTPEAVARIKLTLLTGVDPAAKIEAVRQLAFAPLDLEEKGRLCLKALAEEHPGIRREAALLLRTLGIAREVSEAIAGLSEGEPGARKLAMAHVAALQSRVTPAEQFILLAVLLAVIREEKDPALAASALEALHAFAPRVVADGELLDRVLRLLYPLLTGESPLAASAAGAIDALGRAHPETVGAALRDELRSAADVPFRRRLLAIQARLDRGRAPGDPCRRALAAALARELGTGTDSDPLCRQLSVEMIALGEDAVGALLETFPAAHPEQRPFLVKLLDDAATSAPVPAAARAAVGEFFLKTWRASGRIVRLALLSTRLPVAPDLPPNLRQEFARCFLADLHDAGFPHVADATLTAIRQMGPDVLPVLRAAATESPHAVERESAVQLYAEILRDAPPPGGASPDLLAEPIAFLRELEHGDRCSAGAVVRATGILLSSPFASPDQIASVAADYRRRLVRSPAAEDMVCALGWIASGPRAPAALRTDQLVLFVELLLRASPDAPVVQQRTDEGIRLEFSSDASRQTDFIRELILAVRRILCADGDSPILPPGLRERAARRLLDQWRLVADYNVIWAPGNVTTLADALGAIALAPGLPVSLRADILAGLLASARSIPIIRTIGLVCGWEGEPDPGPDAAAFGSRCREVAVRFADMLQHVDYSDPEDQDVLLEAIGRIAGAALPGPTPAEAESVRRRLVTCLFDGLAHGHRRAREALERLATSPRLPEDLRIAIRERLDSPLPEGA